MQGEFELGVASTHWDHRVNRTSEIVPKLHVQ